MRAKNPHAVALGKRAKGKPKTMSQEAYAQRKQAGFKPKCRISPENENISQIPVDTKAVPS